MKIYLVIGFLSVFLAACSSTPDNSSDSSAKASSASAKDDCASKEYLARQECLTAKMNAG